MRSSDEVPPVDQPVVAQLSASWAANWDSYLQAGRKPPLIEAVPAFLAQELSRRGVSEDDDATVSRLFALAFDAIERAGTHTPEAIRKVRSALTSRGPRRWLQRLKPEAPTSPPAQQRRAPRRLLRRRFERIAFIIALAFGIAAALGFAGADECWRYSSESIGYCSRWSAGWWFTHSAPISALALVVAFAYDATFGRLVAWVRRGE